MKIIEQTAYRMVLRQRPKAVVFFLLWTSIFSGAPLLMIGSLIANAGVTHLLCQRESAQVNCEFSQSHFFGIVSNKTILQPVTAAQVDVETYSGEDGDYQVYRATLVTPQQSFKLYNFSSDDLTANQVVTQVNQMLQSKQTEIQLSEDTRWDFPRTIAPILFLSLFVMIGLSVFYSMVQVRTVILDKALNRLSYQVWTLLGKRQRDYPLGIVTEVELKEHIDSYGNKYYEPILLPDVVRQVTFSYIHNREQAVQLQEQIQKFLNLSVKSAATKQETESSVVYQNQNRTYTSSGLTAIPIAVPEKVRDYDRKLMQLGFVFISDLNASTFSNLTLYAYANPNKDIYAVILKASHTKASLVTLDFFTSFLNGGSLTTTSSKLAIKHLKAQKIWRWSYPDLDAAQLYQQHQQHLAELQMQLGRAHRAKANLAVFAALVDDFLMRQTSGFFPLLALIVNAFAMSASSEKINSAREQNKTR